MSLEYKAHAKLLCLAVIFVINNTSDFWNEYK